MNGGDGIGHQLGALIEMLNGNEHAADQHLGHIPDAYLRSFLLALSSLAERVRRELVRRKPETEDWS